MFDWEGACAVLDIEVLDIDLFSHARARYKDTRDRHKWNTVFGVLRKVLILILFQSSVQFCALLCCVQCCVQCGVQCECCCSVLLLCSCAAVFVFCSMRMLLCSV